ncbi:MAG: hypothetical protein IJM37_04240 [Lachnospiraceae bacterium]|nr:hypothetical protein [Lachnospiraceae bacterium]
MDELILIAAVVAVILAAFLIIRGILKKIKWLIIIGIVVILALGISWESVFDAIKAVIK